MIEIVPAISGPELDHIRSLFTTYAQWRKHDAALGDFQKELDNLPGKYAPPQGILLLAKRKPEALGCIAYQALGPEICEMKRMFVLEAHRKQGIAKALAYALFEAAKNHGYTHMRLDTHPHMHAAHVLYKNLGFYEIERYNQNPTPGIRFFEKVL